MIKDVRNHCHAEPACCNRSDRDHLRFMVHEKNNADCRFGFTLELNGIKTWAVPDVPSMNPLDQRTAKEEKMYELSLPDEENCQAWDRGNYIPIDDEGNVLDEKEAIECLKKGALKFFLQGKKLVGEFVLMKKGVMHWLLIKRHDEFAKYNQYTLEMV